MTPPSDEDLSQFFDLSLGMLSISDGKGHFLKVNPRFQEVLGFTTEELLDTRVDQIMHPDDLGAVSAARADLAAGRMVRDLRVRWRHKDGSYRTLLWSSQAVPGTGHIYSVANDVTEAEQDAAELAAFFETTPELMLVSDGQGHLLKVNPAYLTLLGWSEAEALATRVDQLIHPDDLAALAAARATAASGGTVTDLRIRFRCKDGSYRTLQWVARSDTRRGRAYVSGRDVTEEIQREAELVRTAAEARQGAATVSAFFELSLDLLAVGDMEGHLLTLNPRWEEVLGYPLADLIGANVLELTHPDDVERTIRQIAENAGGGAMFAFKNRIRCSDGSYRTLLWAARAVPAEGRVYLYAKDITESDLHEAELEHLALIFETSPDVIAIFEPDGRVIRLNQAAREVLGLDDPDARPDSVLACFPAGAAATFRADIIPAALDTGSWSGELPIAHARGGLFETDVVVRTHSGPGADHTHLWLRAADVSRYKAVERLKDEFISTVSHELRTPLTSIRGSLGLIEGGAMGEISPKVMNMVHIANSNTDRLIRLINDVMDLEKMRSGRIELRREPMALTSAALVAITEVEHLAGQAGIRLVKDFQQPAPVVLGDHDRIVQLAVNLVSNAVKFSPRDSTVTVRVAAGSGQGTAAISVTDEGPGIAPDKLRWIFERFTQVDSSTTRHKSGTGLGLAIARDIAELHGGTLEVASEPGHGATFTFTMPTTDEHFTPVIAEPGRRTGAADTVGREQPQASLAPGVLVVEDDEALSTVYEALLTGAGYRVRTALSLAEARAALRSSVPDAILLDMRLGDGSGLELLSDLAQDERYAAIAVIAVTGSVDEPVGTLPVVVDWVRKPVDNVKLLSRLALDLAGVGQPRVLVVEDDQDTAEVVSELVKQIGCLAHISPDGRQALEYLAANHVDLMILDIGLPVMDGYDLVAALGRLGATNLPIVVYTGLDIDSEQRARLTYGLTTYLTKTQFTEAQLQDAIREGLARRAAQGSQIQSD